MYKSEHQNQWYILEGDSNIHTIGRVHATNLHPNRILPFWVFGVVSSGQRTIRVNQQEAYLTAGDYFLLPANIHHCGIEEDKHDAYFIHFDIKGKQISPPSKMAASKIILPVFGNLPKDTDILRSFAYLNEQFHSGLVNNVFLNIQLKAILFQISLYMQKRKVWTTRNHHLGDDIFRFIQNHLSEDLNFHSFEQHFQLSYRQLNVIFKNQFKTTIKQKLIELRIHHAMNLLLQGESIAYAAEHAGFKDYFYFLKCFKRMKDITPSDLKNKYLL